MSEGLRTLPEEYTGWGARVQRGSFLTNRGDVVTTGTEAIIYRRSQLDVVLKEIREDKTSKGYEIAAELIPDLVAPFEFVEGLSIQVDFGPHIIQRGIAQAKVSPLDMEFLECLNEKDVPRLAGIVQDFATVNREIFKRGVFIPDPAYANYGRDKKGQVVLSDAGGIITGFEDIAKFMVYANGRGKVHYSHYLTLKKAGLSFKKLFQDQPLESLYANLTGLDFDPALFSLEQFLAYLTPNQHIFHNLFWEVGQQEFERFASSLPFTRDEQQHFLDLLASQ